MAQRENCRRDRLADGIFQVMNACSIASFDLPLRSDSNQLRKVRYPANRWEKIALHKPLMFCELENILLKYMHEGFQDDSRVHIRIKLVRLAVIQQALFEPLSYIFDFTFPQILF